LNFINRYDWLRCAAVRSRDEFGEWRVANNETDDLFLLIEIVAIYCVAAI
jgi:hypothetical protein